MALVGEDASCEGDSRDSGLEVNCTSTFNAADDKKMGAIKGIACAFEKMKDCMMASTAGAAAEQSSAMEPRNDSTSQHDTASGEVTKSEKDAPGGHAVALRGIAVSEPATALKRPAPTGAAAGRRAKRRRRGHPRKVPTRLLLGGTVTDPLNLAELRPTDGADGQTESTRQAAAGAGPVEPPPSAEPAASSPAKPDPRGARFQYGNYNRYYGYRNGAEPDRRLQCLRPEWFRDRDVLDVGCNIGHVTLTVARDFQPRRCVGLDIDASLIKIARKNVKHYCRPTAGRADRVPLSVGASAEPGHVPFPRNVSFVHANFVLESDALLETVRPEFDTILCLSITKWVHLNWGDAGILRFFRRAFLSLRPGGRLLLEPQPWSSYVKKKKLTPHIWETFQRLRLRPEQFTALLLDQIGFQSCQPLGRPRHTASGFSRQLQLFTKPGSSCSTSDSQRISAESRQAPTVSDTTESSEPLPARNSAESSEHLLVKSSAESSEPLSVNCSAESSEGLPMEISAEMSERLPVKSSAESSELLSVDSASDASASAESSERLPVKKSAESSEHLPVKNSAESLNASEQLSGVVRTSANEEFSRVAGTPAGSRL